MTSLCHSQSLDALLRSTIRFDVEEVWAVALNSKLELIASEMIFRGHAAGCTIHPREIFRFAIRENAVHLALGHSHPSGDFEASDADLKLTQDLFELGRWLKIPLVDHLVLSARGYSSMSDAGHFRKWQKRRARFAARK